MSKLSVALGATFAALAATASFGTTASAGMYMPPMTPVAKPKPVRQPPKVVAPPNVWGGRPSPGQPYRPVVVVRPPSTQLGGGVTVVTKPRR